jgi:hypothetical protein
MADSAGVVHDAASLFRFVDTIQRFCNVGKGYPQYLSASRNFLVFVQQLADSTKRYLSDFPSRLPPDPKNYPVYRQELFTLRAGWSEIHRRVKPIADADTLHVPSALINSLLNRLQKIPRFANTQLAVMHTEWLNYLQVVASRIRSTADDIATLVGANPFPRDLGLVGIPYSQSESVLLNCVIAHEIGHFVFGELRLESKLSSEARTILTSVFQPVANRLRPDDRKRMPTLFAGWTEELFCDLFAVRLIGPCYTYAYVEIFDLANILHADATLNKYAAGLSLMFNDSHPADLYRIRQQTALIERLGWWKEIGHSQSNATKVLGHSAKLNAIDFSFPSLKHVEKEVLTALDQLAHKIATEVEESLSGLDSGVSEYSRLKKTVREYFLHGVVPSVISDPKSGSKESPDAVTILNVAYQLYLDDLSELLNRIQNQDASSVADRTRWTQSLEAWTLKALDDLELISRVTVAGA